MRREASVWCSSLLMAMFGGLSTPRIGLAWQAPSPIGVEVQVRRALKGQAAILNARERLSADPDLLEGLGLAAGRQVRVVRGPDDFAVYTVGEARDETPESVVRIGRKGRERLGTSDPFQARVLPFAPRSDLSDAEAERLGEVVERLRDDADAAGLLILAPHGGDIEKRTAEQAERLYEALRGKPVVRWTIKGYGRPGGPSASVRWHVTATDLSEASYPLLAEVAGRDFAHAVSFHGMSGAGVLIGGAAPSALKEEVKAALERKLDGTGTPIRIAGPESRIGGKSPRNVVNRYCRGGGIQIEQGPAARRDHWREIADALAEVYGPRL